MTDDIKWGEPIEVDGKRPEWLRDDEKCKVVWLDQEETGPFSVSCIYGWRGSIKSIRLPADHPYYLIGYRKRAEQPAPAYPPELVERAFALLRDMGAISDGDMMKPYFMRARDILSELEPKDPDMEAVQAVFDDNGMHLSDDVRDDLVAIIKRVREGG